MIAIPMGITLIYKSYRSEKKSEFRNDSFRMLYIKHCFVWKITPNLQKLLHFPKKHVRINSTHDFVQSVDLYDCISVIFVEYI